MAGKNKSIRPQPWDWPHPRVLLETGDAEANSVRADALRRAGYAIAICSGPTAEGRCPLAGDDGCAAAEGADVVVSSLGLNSEVAREPLAALRARLPDLPVLVEADRETAERWPDLVPEDARLEPGIESFELVDRVRKVLGEEVSGSE